MLYFQISTSKISMYVIDHSIVPYFQTLLTDALGKSEIHVYSFDKILNDSTQTSEMDLYVSYWDDLDKLVKVRYYRSSSHLLGHFNELIKKLKSENLYQVSMDGPNVNNKFYEDFSRKFGDENYHKLIDIGRCSLRIDHGAFRVGGEQSEWELKKFHRGIHCV